MRIQDLKNSTSLLTETLSPRHLGTTGDAPVSRKITYPSSGNNSAFAYEPFGKMVRIIETVASSVTSTKQHIWCGTERCEERDGTGSPSKQFFSRGQTNSSTNYFYSKDHLGSIRSMTDDNGDVQAAYSFDPFGRPEKLEGVLESDFQFAGYYLHARSGLNLTIARAYSADLGRFINRDPIGEDGGINLYGYVQNDPLGAVDPQGTYAVTGPPVVVIIIIVILIIVVPPLVRTPQKPQPKCRRYNPPPDWDSPTVSHPELTPTPPPLTRPPRAAEDECIKCLTTFDAEKLWCNEHYPAGPRRQRCVSDAVARRMQCQAEHCR